MGPTGQGCFWAWLLRATHQSLCKARGNLKPREEQDSGWHSINPKNYDKPSAALHLPALWNISGAGCLTFFVLFCFPLVSNFPPLGKQGREIHQPLFARGDRHNPSTITFSLIHSAIMLIIFKLGVGGGIGDSAEQPQLFTFGLAKGEHRFPSGSIGWLPIKKQVEDTLPGLQKGIRSKIKWFLKADSVDWSVQRQGWCIFG